MLKSAPITWATHIEILNDWDKSIAEYARINNLNSRILYHKRYVSNKLKSKPQTKVNPREKRQFIPIKLSGPSTKSFSIKIFSNNLTYELSGLSISAIKELLHSPRGN